MAKIEEARDAILRDLPEEVELVFNLEALKEIERQNPLGLSQRKERVAEHSWHVALAVTLLADYSPEPIDVAKATLLATFHDIVEVFVGDTFAFGPKIHDKESRERAAMQQLRQSGNSPATKQLVDLWEEYEDQQTAEARFVKGIDAFLPIVMNFTNPESSSWVEHGVRAEQVLKRLNRVRESLGDLAKINDHMIAQAQTEGRLK